MYCAVTGSFNTVWFPWVTVVESLVQVTVVAGPPVEIQVRMKDLESSPTDHVSPRGITTFPAVFIHTFIPFISRVVAMSL